MHWSRVEYIIVTVGFMVCHKFNYQSYNVFKILPRALFVILHALIIFHQYFSNYTGFKSTFGIIFKDLVISYKAINDMAPTYISGLITIKSKSNYLLRSKSELLLQHPRLRTKKTLGDRAFCAATSKLWNVLPDRLREITSVDSFKDLPISRRF